MQSHDIEYRTTVKDTDQCLIHKAACEVVDHSDSILSKYMAEFKENTCDDSGHNILGVQWK